jgi:hypothetical protein
MAVLPIVIEMLTTRSEAYNDTHHLPGSISRAVIPFGLTTTLKKYHPIFNHLKTMMA